MFWRNLSSSFSRYDEQLRAAHLFKMLIPTFKLHITAKNMVHIIISVVNLILTFPKENLMHVQLKNDTNDYPRRVTDHINNYISTLRVIK